MFKKFVLSIGIIFASYSSHAFDTKAKYAILIDYNTGSILYEKNAFEKTAPSSMSKLLTTYVVFEQLKNKTISLDDKFIVSNNAREMGGSRMFIESGSQVRLEDLLLGVIVQSGNDATVAIAEALAGTEQEFVRILNKKARDLGLTATTLTNATGWPEPDHLMSSMDLAILARRLIDDFPEYYHYFSMKEFTYNNIKQPNRNRLLFEDVSGVDGLKTGHTEIAGYGLTTSAKKGGRRLILVVNGLSSEQERANEVLALVNYGFNSFSNINIVQSGTKLTEVPLWRGDARSVNIVASKDLSFSANNFKIDNVSATLHYKSPLIAPIKKGEVIGKIIINGVSEEPIIEEVKALDDYKEASIFTKLIRKIFG